jgi:choline dehydrogenase
MLDPGPDVDTDEEILEAIKNSIASAWHAAGTCRMGLDEMSVLDAQARVYGVEGLRVVDTSSFPVLHGHPQSTVYALAEKIADSIIRGL